MDYVSYDCGMLCIYNICLVITTLKNTKHSVKPFKIAAKVLKIISVLTQHRFHSRPVKERSGPGLVCVRYLDNCVCNALHVLKVQE